jgi:hypothetical protein
VGAASRIIRLHDFRHAHDAGHRRDIADEFEAKIVTERRIDGGGRRRQEKRIAVRGRSNDELGADIAAGGGTE